MWAQYKKTFLPMQLFIVAACAASLIWGKMPWPVVAVIFLVMQAGALLGAWSGAWWGGGLRRRIQDRGHELPLQRRK